MAGKPLTDSIEALIAYANQTTGASDTNLSDAVYTLAQGYGSGLTPVAEVLLTANINTTQDINNIVLSSYTNWTSNHIYLVKFNNNNYSGAYRGVKCVFIVGGDRSAPDTKVYMRNENSTTTTATSWQFHVDNGATMIIIDVSNA